MTGLILIQARLGSTRFPRKILAPLAGKPLLQHTVERAMMIGPPVIVCTPDRDFEEIAAVVPSSASVFASRDVDEGDVLGRFYEATRGHTDLDYIIRLTADSPFIDPAIGIGMIRAWSHRLQFGLWTDYLAPCYSPPLCRDGGLDLEMLSIEAFRAACHEVVEPEDREHPTRYLWRQPGRFVCLKHTDPPGYGKLGIDWMVDEPDDLPRLERIASRLKPEQTSWQETLAAQAAAETL